jgi:hypothetical protein
MAHEIKQCSELVDQLREFLDKCAVGDVYDRVVEEKIKKNLMKLTIQAMENSAKMVVANPDATTADQLLNCQQLLAVANEKVKTLEEARTLLQGLCRDGDQEKQRLKDTLILKALQEHDRMTVCRKLIMNFEQCLHPESSLNVIEDLLKKFDRDILHAEHRGTNPFGAAGVTPRSDSSDGE